MKVVLVNPPQYTRYSQPPMGLALLAAVLERDDYPVQVLDANALGLKPQEVPPHVADADVVGLTAMTPTAGTAISIARHLKQANPAVTVILGGAHATLLPEETLRRAPEIDIIVRGEGEETIIELLMALEKKQPLGGIAGISFREDGAVVSTADRTSCVDMDSLPFLAYHLLPWRKYRPHPPHGRALPFAAIITSRGCPYHCAYCSKPIFGRAFRAQSPKRVLAEIAHLKKRFGIKEIAFYDDVFTLDRQRAYDIADGMVKRGLALHWTFETRVNLVDAGLLQRIRQAGGYAVAYGIESASPEILKTISKNITLEQVEEAVGITRQAELQTVGYFMLGSPGESPQTIQQTISFARKLELDFAQFAITIPFPGTELYGMLGEQKKDIPWESFAYEGADNRMIPLFENSQLSREDLKKWQRRAYRRFYLRPGYIWRRLKHLLRSPGELRMNIEGLFMFLASVMPSRRKAAE